MNMVKTRFLIFYSIVCTMVLNKLFPNLRRYGVFGVSLYKFDYL